MSALHTLWTAWPNVIWAGPALAYHHWKIKVTLARHALAVTATLNDHLTIMAGISDHPADTTGKS